MSPTKILECEVYCPCCKTYHGKVYRKEVREGFWEHVSEPKKMPKYCNVCEGVLVRK